MIREDMCDMGLFCGLIISEARGVLRIKIAWISGKRLKRAPMKPLA